MVDVVGGVSAGKSRIDAAVIVIVDVCQHVGDEGGL